MAPSPTIRRLLKETSELSSTSKNPNPAFHAAPVSDTDLHEWHFTLLGPPAPSPFAGGLYHGRISLPPSYPLKPPNFRFLTPSGRFEVNREICLSISGFHEETWMPAWGVRTALTALRSFMAESGTAGQVGGLEAPKEVRERLAKESRVWRCKECGSRTNEEIMSEWWEACAQKGAKVGEDVGLEVLPEGLSLEVKTPGGKGKEAETSIDNVERKHEQDVKATTQAILHDEDPSNTPGSTGTNAIDSRDNVPSGTLPSTAQPQTQEFATEIGQSNHSSLQPTLDFNTSATTPIPPQYQPQPRTQHQHTTSSTNQSAPQMTNPSTITNPALTNLQRPRYPQEIQNQQADEVTTVTIDRAIYVVFLALCIMILKKIFYPASAGGFWGDGAVVRD